MVDQSHLLYKWHVHTVHKRVGKLLRDLEHTKFYSKAWSMLKLCALKLYNAYASSTFKPWLEADSFCRRRRHRILTTSAMTWASCLRSVASLAGRRPLWLAAESSARGAVAGWALVLTTQRPTRSELWPLQPQASLARASRSCRVASRFPCQTAT